MKKWTKTEEIEFLKDVAKGTKICDLVSKYNRTESALNLRLKKIVFDNISSGKKESDLAKMININRDTIRQYYYEYKAFLEKKGMLNTEINKIQTAGTLEINQNILNKDDDLIEIFKKKIDRLEKENKIMHNILDNIELKNKMKTLIDNKVLDKKIKKYIRKIIKN